MYSAKVLAGCKNSFQRAFSKGKPNYLIVRLSFSPVIPIGFEPMTDRLEICCSIQLSYGTLPATAFYAVAEKSGAKVRGKKCYTNRAFCFFDCVYAQRFTISAAGDGDCMLRIVSSRAANCSCISWR